MLNYKQVKNDENRVSVTEYVNGVRIYGLEYKKGKFKLELSCSKLDLQVFVGNYDNKENFENAFKKQMDILTFANVEKYFNKLKSKQSNEQIEIKFTSNDGLVRTEVRCIESEKGIYVPIFDDGVSADVGRNYPDVDSAKIVAQKIILEYNEFGFYVRENFIRKSRKCLPHERLKSDMKNSFDLNDLKQKVYDFVDELFEELENEL